MQKTHALLTLLALGVAANVVSSQAVPTTQPGLIQITREIVKPGRDAEHAKWETGWPAAYGRSKSAVPYLALASMTGASEVWYVATYASHAAFEASMKHDDADPMLNPELERLSKGDAEFLSDIRRIHAIARPDLGVGGFPDVTKKRFWEISVFRARIGREDQFEAAAKAYMSSFKRAAPDGSIRAYQVVAGMTSGTYLFFSSYTAFSDLDQAAAMGEAAMKGANAEELAALQKGSDAIMSIDANRYRLDPGQSYVSKEVRASDPAFWMPKKPATKP